MKPTTALAVCAATLGFALSARAVTATVAWEGADFASAASKTGTDGNTYTFTLGDGNSTEGDVVTIGETATKGALITLGDTTKSDVSVLIEYANVTQPAANSEYIPVAVGMVQNSAKVEVGLKTKAANTAQIVGYYGNSSERKAPYPMKDANNADIYPSFVTTGGSGYLLLSFSASGGTRGYAGETLATLSGGANTGLAFSGRTMTSVALGGPSGEVDNTFSAWKGMTIKRVAVFVGQFCSASDVASYKFPSESTAYAATLGATAKWSEISWDDSKTWANGNPATLTITGDTELTLDTDVSATDITVSYSGSTAITLTLKGSSANALASDSLALPDNVSLVVDGTNLATLNGAIAGGAGVTLTAGTTTFAGASTYTGNFIVKNGAKAIAGGSAAFGAPVTTDAPRRVVVENGGQIDVNGQGAEYVYTIAGDGTDGSGALVNNGSDIGADTAEVTGIELTADATVGGTSQFGFLGRGYGDTSLKFLASNLTLTKKGTGTFLLCQVSNSTDAAYTGGKIVLAEGSFNVFYKESDLSGLDITVKKGASLVGYDAIKYPDAYFGTLKTDKLTLEEGATVTVPSGKTWTATNGFVVDGTLTVIGTLATSAATAVTGATTGVVAYSGKQPDSTGTTGPTWWTNSDWKGTVAVSGYTTEWTNIDLNKYGNDGSKVQFSDVQGYWTQSQSAATVFSPELVLVNGTSGYAFKKTNGYQTGYSLPICFTKLSGTGVLDIANNIGNVYVFKSAAGFTGTIRRTVTGNNGTVMLVEDTEAWPTFSYYGSLKIANGKKIAIGNGNGWTGLRRIDIAGEVDFKGNASFSASEAGIGLSDGATLKFDAPVAGGVTLATTGTVTVGADDTVSIALAEAPTAASYTLISWSAAPAGSFAFASDETTAEAAKGYTLRKTATGLQMVNSTGIVSDGTTGYATVAAAIADGSGSTLTLQGDSYDEEIIVSRDVTIDLNGHALTFASITGGEGKLTITDSAADSTQSLTLPLAGDIASSGLTVKGDLTVTGYGNITMMENASISVSGTLTFTPSTDTYTVINTYKHTDYTLKVTGAYTISAQTLSGGATLDVSGRTTVASAGDFYGTITGIGGLQKNGADTLYLRGPNALTGTLNAAAGTISFAGILDSLSEEGAIRYDFDASDTSTLNFVSGSDTQIASNKKGDTVYADASSGHYAVLTNSASVFGGKPVMYFDGSTSYKYGTDTERHAYSYFYVLQQPESLATDMRLLHITHNTSNPNNGSDQISLLSQKWQTTTGGTANNWAVYVDGQATTTATASRDSVVSVVKSVTTGTRPRDTVGYTFAGFVAQALGFSRVISLEERAAAEAYLMNKWSCTDAAAFQPVVSGASLQIGSTATLDLGIYTPTVKKLTLGNGATIAVDKLPDDNILLKTSDGISEPTGDGNTVEIAYNLLIGGVNASTLGVTLKVDGNNLVAVRANEVYDVEANATDSTSAVMTRSPYLGSLTKTGEGTLLVFGANTYDGTVNVEGGTLKVAAPQDLGTVLYDFDANVTGSISTGGTFEWRDAAGRSGAPTLASDSDATSPTLTTLGGKPYVSSEALKLYTSANVAPAMSFMVWQVTSSETTYPTPMADNGGSGNSQWGVIRRWASSNPVNYYQIHYYGSDYKSDYVWSNGSTPATIHWATPELLSVRSTMWLRNPGQNTAYYSGNHGASIGEILTFSTEMADVDREQVEAYLLDKWGIDSTKMADYAPLSPNSTLTIAQDAVVDLNGFDQTVANLDCAGTITGGALTVTGTATFKAGAVIDIGDATAAAWMMDVGGRATGVENIAFRQNGRTISVRAVYDAATGLLSLKPLGFTIHVR